MNTTVDQGDRLFASALAIVSARTVQEMLRETTTRAAEIVGARQALTSLTVDHDWTSAITTVYLEEGPPAGGSIDATLAARSSVTANVCRGNAPLRLSSEDLEPLLGSAQVDALPLTGGYLAVPLMGREGRNLGLIQLTDPRRGSFSAGDEDVVVAVAQFTAMAIEQLRLHADLAYQSRLTRSVAENATSGLFLLDSGGRVTYMNSAGREIVGYDIDQIRDRTFHETVHHSRPDGTPLPIEECRIWRSAIGDESLRVPFEDAFVRPDGTFYPVRVSAAPISRDERVVSVVIEIQDISQERAVARRLRDLALSAAGRAAELRGLIESIGDAVVVCGPDGTVSLTNPSAIQMFGSHLEHVGQLVGQLRTEDGSPVAPNEPIDGSYLLDRRERETWVEARAFAVPMGRSEGRPDDPADHSDDHGQIYVVRDVTSSRQAKVLRETFIGMLSHELRTPITTVFGGTKVLSRRTDTLTPEMRSIVGDIEAEAERLYRLVEDLVVLTKSEAATLEAGREPVLLQRILPRLVAAEARRWPTLHFDVACPADLAPVLAEPTYIEQVVRNLLTNAAKYGGSAGNVEVVASTEGPEIVARVLDRGPGFPEGDSDRLFDIYYRSPQVTRRAAGAGIGLFVSKSLVEAMGGRIWALERDGGGAEFGFALPALTDPGDDEPR